MKLTEEQELLLDDAARKLRAIEQDTFRAYHRSSQINGEVVRLAKELDRALNHIGRIKEAFGKGSDNAVDEQRESQAPSVRSGHQATEEV